MTQHKQSHRIKSHRRTSHHIALHQNRSHHHHGTAEGSFTAKTWFGHRAGRSPCAHSIGKFFLCYILLFSSETSAPGSPGNCLYIYLTIHIHIMLQNEVIEPQCFQSALQRFLPRLYFRTPLCWSRMDFLELLSRGLMFEGSVANKIVKQPFTRVYLWKKDKLNFISQRSHDFSLKSLCAAWWCYSVRPWWSQATKCCNWYSDRCGLWTFWAVVGPLWKLKGLCWLEIQCLLRSWNPKNPLDEDVFARFDLKSCDNRIFQIKNIVVWIFLVEKRSTLRPFGLWSGRLVVYRTCLQDLWTCQFANDGSK